MNRTQQAIVRTATKHEGGYTVKLPNGRKTSRDAMAAMRTAGLVVNEVRNGWAGNWLTPAGMAAGNLEDYR